MEKLEDLFKYEMKMAEELRMSIIKFERENPRTKVEEVD